MTRRLFAKDKRSAIVTVATSVVRYWLAAIVVWLVTCGTVAAQTPAALSAPDLHLYTNGIVHAIVRQTDGSVVFGGRFSQVNGVTRTNIARLMPDGQLDPNWNPSFADQSSIFALASDGKGNIYVGYADGGLIRISGSGSGAMDTTWVVTAAFNFYALAVDSIGNVYVSGNVYGSDGIDHTFARLSPKDGAIDATWSPKISGRIRAIAVDKDDNVYVGGVTAVGGQSRSGLAKIAGTSGAVLDVTWNPAVTSTTGNTSVKALALDDGGNLYVGGTFTTIGGQSRSNIAKLSSSGTGAADAQWNPSADGAVNALAIGSDGNVYAGGTFASIGGELGSPIAKLSATATGRADTAWLSATPDVSGNVIDTIVPNGSNGVYVGGFFSTFGNQQRHSFASVSATGTLGNAVDTISPGGVVNSITLQSNGGALVGGYFSGAGEIVRTNVLRLRTDGSVDPDWNVSTDAPNQIGVETIAVDSGGAIYLGGEFTRVAGQPRTGVAKLSAQGAVEPSWGVSTGIGGYYFGVEALVAAADGNIYLAGDFATVGSQPRVGLARITSSGNLDTLWNSASNFSAGDQIIYSGGIRTLAVDSDGSVYTNHRNSSDTCLRKYSATPTGSIDPTWMPPSIYQQNGLAGCTGMSALALDGQGHLYVGGNGLVRLFTKDGSADPNWNSVISGGLSFSNLRFDSDPHVYALALDETGDIFVGGEFSLVNNLTIDSASGNSQAGIDRSRPYLVKISTADNAAVDINWNPVANDVVYALALNNAGSLFAGGTFSKIGDLERGGFGAVAQHATANPLVPDNLNQFGWTGAWYNPGVNGQGVLFQVIPSQDSSGVGMLFGGWFTFDTFGSEKRWYTVQGPVDVTSKSIGLPIYATGNFYPYPLAIPTYAGEAFLSFDDCNHGTLSLSLYDPGTNLYSLGNFVAGGSLSLVRLSSNIFCTPDGDAGQSPDYLLSGAWSDPSQNFSGLLFDVDPVQNIFFAAWYLNGASQNYPNASPLTSNKWYTLQAPFTSGMTTLDPLPIYETKGGILGTPSPVTITQVGVGKLIFADCNDATLTYSFSAGADAGTSGTLNLSRGAAKPANCNP